MGNVKQNIVDLVRELGFAEWSCPEHAEEILKGLIERYSSIDVDAVEPRVMGFDDSDEFHVTAEGYFGEGTVSFKGFQRAMDCAISIGRSEYVAGNVVDVQSGDLTITVKWER